MTSFARFASSVAVVIPCVYILVVDSQSVQCPSVDESQNFYDREIGRTIQKLLNKTIYIQEDGELFTREAYELEEVPRTGAQDVPLLGSSIRPKFESLVETRRCILRSQSGRVTAVDTVRIEGGFALLNPAAIDCPFELFTPASILQRNFETGALTRKLCTSRNDSTNADYTIPLLSTSSDAELVEQVEDTATLGQVIDKCDKVAASELMRIPCEGDGASFEVQLVPGMALDQLGAPKPNEVVQMTFSSGVYVLQVVSAVTIVLESLILASTTPPSSGKRMSKEVMTHLMLIGIGLIILVVTVTFNCIEIASRLQSFTRAFVTCRIDQAGRTNGVGLSFRLLCSIQRVSSTVPTSSLVVLAGPLCPILLLSAGLVLQLLVKLLSLKSAGEQARPEDGSGFIERPYFMEDDTG